MIFEDVSCSSCFPASVPPRFRCRRAAFELYPRASDMGVTPAAISHQIKELEEQIGASLFPVPAAACG